MIYLNAYKEIFQQLEEEESSGNVPMVATLKKMRLQYFWTYTQYITISWPKMSQHIFHWTLSSYVSILGLVPEELITDAFKIFFKNMLKSSPKDSNLSFMLISMQEDGHIETIMKECLDPRGK